MARAEGLSPSELRFVRDGIAADLRGDGRTRAAFRTVSVEPSVVPQANGSSRVVVGGTQLLVGVRAELATPAEERPGEGIVLATVDATAAFPPDSANKDVDELNALLERFLETLLVAPGVLDLEKLCLVPGKYCWQLSVDVVALRVEGNLHDAMSVAAVVALGDVALPRITVSGDGTGEDEVEMEVTDDPNECDRLDASQVPVAVTVVRVGGHLVVDPSPAEEACADAQLVVAVTRKAAVVAMQQAGAGGMPPKGMAEAIRVAQATAANLFKRIDAQLRSAALREASGVPVFMR